MARNTIFISHATPEDNDFAMWLASRLSLAGYKVWCDLFQLIGGEEDFWGAIQNVIDNQAIKFILVYSRNTFTKSGVKNEFSQAESVAQKYALKDFVVPVKIDNVSFSARIGINTKNIIDFKTSWHAGYSKLLRKLTKDMVPLSGEATQTNIDRYLKPLVEPDSLVSKKETYYSNWVKLDGLPSTYYVFRYPLDKYAIAVEENSDVGAVVRIGNHIATFEMDINDCMSKSIYIPEPNNIELLSVTSVIRGEDTGKQYPTTHDARNLLVALVSKSMHNFFISKGLMVFSLANYPCYYFPVGRLEKDKSNYFFKGNKMRPIKLLGKYYDGYWHYAISCKVNRYPFLHVSLKYHIVFTEDGKVKWFDTNKMISARRKKGSNLWNKELRTYLFAFLAAIAEDNNKIEIPLRTDFNLILDTTPVSFESDIGYNDVDLASRIQALDEKLAAGDIDEA